jgi:glycosyltransferase involved in cell wall biosynthesis
MAIEQEILGRAKFIFGRTDWDRRITAALAPQAEYFHVDEVIRAGFYGLEWAREGRGLGGTVADRRVPVFFTTSSPSIYKGFETIIDTARILAGMGVTFEWLVAGLKAEQPLVRLTMKDRKVTDLAALNIRLLGTLGEKEVAERLLNCDAYIQVSHIENSPNSVCEAMLAGVPVVASFAGGTGSLLKDGVHGALVQDGDPYALAGAMQEVISQPATYAAMAAEGRKAAQRRHNPPVIVAAMIGRYGEIIHKSSGK